MANPLAYKSPDTQPVPKKRSVRPRVDFFDLWDLEYGEDLPCRNGYVLLWALLSNRPGEDWPIKSQPSVYCHYTTITIYGPIADEAVKYSGNTPELPEEYRLRVRYKLTAKEIESWSEAERQALSNEIDRRARSGVRDLTRKALGLDK